MSAERYYLFKDPLPKSPLSAHPDLMAVEYEENAILINTPLNGTGPRGLLDSAYFEENKVPKWIGQKKVWLNLFPKNSHVSMLATNKIMSLHPELYPVILENEGIEFINGLGGQDPARSFGERADIHSNSKYGFQPHRDFQNRYLIQAAEKLGLDIYGGCRFMEVYLLMQGGRLSEADPHHRPEDPNNDPLVHPVQSLLIPNTIYPALDTLTEVNSHHHKQVKLKDIDREAIATKGWYVYYVDSTYGISGESAIEVMVRIDDDANITGVLFQGHPERFENNENGEKMKKWMHNIILLSHERRKQKQLAA